MYLVSRDATGSRSALVIFIHHQKAWRPWTKNLSPQPLLILLITLGTFLHRYQQDTATFHSYNLSTQ